MSACERKILRRASLPPPFMPAGKRLLQRRCACGGASGMTGSCEACSQPQLGGTHRAAQERPALSPSRLPVGERAPHALPVSGALGFAAAHPGHDFGRVRVNDSDSAAGSSLRPSLMQGFSEQSVDDEVEKKPAEREASSPAVDDDDSELKFMSNAGEASCDIETGQVTGETNTSNCTSDCTSKHEAKHIADVSPCCQKASKAFKKATTDEAKQSVKDKAQKWGDDNRPYLECRAYTASVSCADAKKMALKCDAQEPTDSGCCSLLRAYRRKMLSMKTYYCDPAPKSTPCPFP